jgi:hypothetical protein
MAYSQRGMKQGCQMVCFQTKNPNFGEILEGLAMENLGIFYDHMVYFTAIRNILRPFGIFYDHLLYISPFWYFVPKKIWQPWNEAIRRYHYV